ncbi:MAG: DUF933 domain-containing protein [bacterium]
MKIGFTGIDIVEGKVKYDDESLNILRAKDNPKKFSPYFVEFVRDVFIRADAIVIPKIKILDLLIHDIQQIENRLARIEDEQEKKLLARCLEQLEKEIPLCDMPLDENDQILLRNSAPYSTLPVVMIEGSEDVNTIITRSLEKAGYMFFYTTGPAESHSWLVRLGSTIVTCAEAIHTDLAKGFIKGDVAGFDDYLTCHNFNDCRAKGLVRLVDRNYIVQPKEILEIRFK